LALAIYAGKTQAQKAELAESSDTSEEKQLDPTERRLERAREEGQFAQSRDLTTFLVLLPILAVSKGEPLLNQQHQALHQRAPQSYKAASKQHQDQKGCEVSGLGELPLFARAFKPPLGRV